MNAVTTYDDEVPMQAPSSTAEAIPYALAERPFDRWNPVIGKQVEPTPDMVELIEATRRALDAGLFYNTDVYDAVVSSMATRVTPEILAVGMGKVERGNFGTEVYCARKYLEACDHRRQLDAAHTHLNPRPGLKLGVLIFNDWKQTAACVIASVNLETGLIKVHGKRGKVAVAVECTALAILNARERYQERTARKTATAPSTSPTADLFG